jgi:hypothetical protein
MSPTTPVAGVLRTDRVRVPVPSSPRWQAGFWQAP